MARTATIIKALNDYVYRVEDLCNDQADDIYASLLKIYSDSALDERAVMRHVLQSETGIPVARLMRLTEEPDALKIPVRWKGLTNSEDTLEPLLNVYEDVPKMLHRLLDRKNTPPELVCKARTVPAL